VARPSGDGREVGQPLPGQGERAGPGPGALDPQPLAESNMSGYLDYEKIKNGGCP
jgi:hypothetical protein